MGQQVAIAVQAPGPTWPAVKQQLLDRGHTAIVRMIDGLPAFPDEEPEPTWGELRIALSGGMVTIRRTASEWICTTWGTADPALQESVAACVAAISAWRADPEAR